MWTIAYTDGPIESTDGEESTRATDPDGAAEATGNPSAGDRDEPSTAATGRAFTCWLCRRPLSETEHVRWRGEPVHPDCLLHEPRYLDGSAPD